MERKGSFQELREPERPQQLRKVASHQQLRKPTTNSLGSAMVIGGCGFIGSHITSALLSNPLYDHVSVLSRNPRKNHHLGATYHVCDITNPKRLRELIQKLQPRIIFLCVGSAPDASSKECKSTTVAGTEILLKEATEAKFVDAVVYTSSHLAIQLPRNGAKLTEETARLHTAKTHQTSIQKYKARAETFVLAASSSELKTCALRLPPVYGEGDPYCIPEFFTILRQNKSNVQIGPNKTMFEWLYVKNAVHAHLLASQTLLSGSGAAGEAFFITDALPLPYYTFARKIWLSAGDRVEEHEIRKVPKGLVMTSATINDWATWTATFGLKRPEVKIEDVKRLDEGFEWSAAKAERILKYRPVVGVDEGVRKGVTEALKRPEWKGLQLRGRPEP